METRHSNGWGYLLAALLGAIAGGILVAVATRAIPKMMSQMMPTMMQKMRAQMGECGCSPETCAEMMKGCCEAGSND
jgi:hypothetical protein